VDGASPFEEVQATWNVVAPSAGPALAEAHDAGWGVLVKEAMANGRLGPRGDAADVVSPLAAELAVGVDTVAIAVAAAQPWADVVLSGAVTTDQLQSNAAGWRLDPPEGALEAIARRAEPPETYWKRRSGLAWS